MMERPGIAETTKGFIRTFGPAMAMGAVMWAVIIGGVMAVV